MIAADRPVFRERPILAAAEDATLGEYAVSPEGLGAVPGLSAGDERAEIGPFLVVPRFVKEMIASQERGASDKAPNLTIGQWLHAQTPAVLQRERLRALRRLGLVVL